MKTIWTEPAEQDRNNIFEYIAADNPDAAVEMDELFSIAALNLEVSPYMGHPGQIPGTREFVVHKNYLLVCEVNATAHQVQILSLVHKTKQWPPLAD